MIHCKNCGVELAEEDGYTRAVECDACYRARMQRIENIVRAEKVKQEAIKSAIARKERRTKAQADAKVMQGRFPTLAAALAKVGAK